jgi:hypothetical protein
MTFKLYASRPKHHTTCPVTGGCPTRMLETRFRVLCAKNREDEESFCYITCRGESLPAGLEFITIETIEEENMGIIKNGDCQICGKKANLRNCLGKTLCASCDFVWRSINAKPESVLEALREKMGNEWIRYRLPVKDIPADEPLHYKVSPEEMDAICGQRDAALKELAEVRENLIDVMGQLTSADDRHGEQIAALKHQLECSREELSSAYAEVRELKRTAAEVNDQLLSVVPPATPVSLLSETAVSRDAVLLDLALGVIAGRIVGIDSHMLSVLRQI